MNFCMLIFHFWWNIIFICSHPKNVKYVISLLFSLFINREGIDFSDAQNMQPVQEWELAENLQGALEYQTRYSRFQGVANLTLHFSDNFGGDTTKIYYIGLRGEATQNKRDVVATIVYEVMPNPSDH
ncbi:hypothetical protein ACJX0J_018836, partial [Zea mays]